MRILRKDTSIKVPIGPIVDATDGLTPETGITLGAADQAEVLKHDGSSFTDISANTWAHIADGVYNLTLSTTDTNTAGMLSVVIVDTTVCRPIREDFMVMPTQVYDSFYAGTDVLEVDVKAISGDATAADNLEEAATGIVTGAVTTGSTTTTIETGLSEGTNDHYNGRVIVFTSGSLAQQAATISDYNGTTKQLTVSALTEAPSNTDTFVIV